MSSAKLCSFLDDSFDDIWGLFLKHHVIAYMYTGMFMTWYAYT